MAKLFEPIKLADLEIKNRVVMSPMCQYQASNKQGIAENWHPVHYASRAIGGTGLVLTEMTDVEPRGRITEGCLGIYDDHHVKAFRRIVNECRRYGAKVGIQIAHAGRKSTIPGGDVVAPSPIPFSPQSPTPRALETAEIKDIVEQFARGTERAVEAGVDAIELHGAHGYLIHQFMSPASNQRNDEYGERIRFPLEVVRAVRAAMPKGMPLIFRVSAVEYNDGGYSFDEVLAMCRCFVKAGVDAFDVSTGGNSPSRPEVFPAYQAKYAEVYKQELTVPIKHLHKSFCEVLSAKSHNLPRTRGAALTISFAWVLISVGKLENPHVAESVLQHGQADMVCIGKGMLRDPYWVKSAAVALGSQLEMPGVYNMAYA